MGGAKSGAGKMWAALSIRPLNFKFQKRLSAQQGGGRIVGVLHQR
jgi:hypothetical protein